MKLHRLASLPLVALAVASVVLSGCSPAPVPTPTPTPVFASEEQAFAAAEETYRAYNDAGNARRDGLETPDPQDFLIGTALEGDIDGQTLLRERGLAVKGHVGVERFNGVEATLASDSNRIIAIVCLDASHTQVVDNEGTDVTPPGRAPQVAQKVTFSATDDGLRISHEESSSESSC